MKKKTKLVLIITLIFFLTLILLGAYFIQVPCGGMTAEGYLWDGTCQYGSVFFSNLRNGVIPSTFPLFIVGVLAELILIIFAIIIKRKK